MTFIPIRRRGEIVAQAAVDPCDQALVGEDWRLHPGGYAIRLEHADGKTATVYMHRLILGLGRGDKVEADHINGDRLDNRRVNLRLATRAENCQNVPSNRGSTSEHRGVSWSKEKRKWAAQAQVAGKVYSLGRYDSEERAAEVAAAFRREHMPYAVA